MVLFTYNSIFTKLGNDLDVTDENFVSEDEIMGYINEAVDDAQAAIHNLNYEDKYFLKSSTFSWVNGTSDYTLPADIYANKIRQIFYNNGTDKYEIVRTKDLAATNFIDAGSDYCYLIVNPTAGSLPVARFYPTVAETSTNAMIWYVREMLKVTSANKNTWVCEVPECQNFVFSHAKWNITAKMRRPDLTALAKTSRDEQYENMLMNLQQMTLDEDNFIQQDLSFYSDGYDTWRR